MKPQTTLEHRAQFDAEPAVDRRAIERYVDRILKDPTDVDIETFVCIEECKTWYAEYRRILSEKRGS